MLKVQTTFSQITLLGKILDVVLKGYKNFKKSLYLHMRVYCALKDYISYKQDITTDQIDLPTQEKATNTKNSTMTGRGRKQSPRNVYTKWLKIVTTSFSLVIKNKTNNTITMYF